MTPTRKKTAPARGSRGPRIRVLASRECKAMLARNHVGRVAFVTAEHQIELHPLHYVWTNDAIYGRTSFGAKYAAWMHRPYVAFEVDEVDGMFDWRSVVVHGTVYVLTEAGSKTERADYKRAVAAIRAVLPQAFTPRDPTPYRGVIYRIEPHEISGRAARST